MHVSKKAGHFDKLCDRPLVEISGLEPELAEPKSVVLPLHHTSVPSANLSIFLQICKHYLFSRKKSIIKAEHSSANTPDLTWVLG